jgi:GNAT superfamily N-acetyltransferase
MVNDQQFPDTSDWVELEHQRPAMYMLWPQERPAPQNAPLPPAYIIRSIANEEIDRARPVVELDGALSNIQWSNFRDRVVPDGLFTIECRETSTYVGTISALHNPAATRFYFPGGGELGYLVVAPGHRSQGLGGVLVCAAVQRLLQAGYRHVFLGVQGWRLSAIRCYLKAGFRPFLHTADLSPRWKAIFHTLGLEADEASWPALLPEREP